MPLLAVRQAEAGPEAFEEAALSYMRCNVAYCLLGDDSRYRARIRENLGGGEDPNGSLERFQEKYVSAPQQRIL